MILYRETKKIATETDLIREIDERKREGGEEIKHYGNKMQGKPPVVSLRAILFILQIIP